VTTPKTQSRTLEIAIGLVALVIATVGLLVDAYALALIGLLLTAVGYGVLLGSRNAAADDSEPSR
jgi:hypothetical protein